MTRPSRRSPTGSSLARVRALAPLAVLLAGLAAPTDAGAQSLKLRSLRLPPHELVGTWVSYHGRAQSRGSAIREFDQRLAVVEKQDLENGAWGFWVELKTTDARGSERIERGFFAPASLRGKDLFPGGDGSQLKEGSAPETSTPPDPAHAAGAAPSDSGAFVLLRYQVLTPGGKLYEYPVGTTRHARASGDVASFELFEYDPTVTPVSHTVGPDTLLLGRRLVPATVEQTVRHGTDRWPMGDDPNVEYHLVLTQTAWKNPAVPLTGYARSVFQVDVKPVAPPGSDGAGVTGVSDSTGAASPADSAAAADSTAAGAVPDNAIAAGAGAPPDSATVPTDPAGGAPADPPGTAEDDRARGVLAWTEMTLIDLGADARPEVDQAPELAPDFDEADIDPSDFQR